ncbi:MAG: hypothetical protein J6C49_07315 [Elusimicrobiaceae bacterium]|nr:hypothetical protein [Elusimicrobiaceae bacterium]
MKRFYLFCLLVLISFPIQAKNKISMVTYFPVPYVAYSQVNTTDQMDIGLTNTCDMKLGCSEPSATLNANRVNITGGKLNLDGGLGIKGGTLSLGNGNGDGKISFQNVRIQMGTMESVNAQDIKATSLNLFGKVFPSCKAANSESGGQMQWTSLKLKGASSSELYLACGSPLSGTECGAPKTKWDGTRCICPGSYDYYIPENNACCSYQTPQTDTRCWKKVLNGQNIWGNSHTYSVNSSLSLNICEKFSGNIRILVANGQMIELPPCSGSIGAACSTGTGSQCVEKCTRGRCVENCSLSGIAKYEYTVTKWVCAPDSSQVSETYQALWDPAVHKKY